VTMQIPRLGAVTVPFDLWDEHVVPLPCRSHHKLEREPFGRGTLSLSSRHSVLPFSRGNGDVRVEARSEAHLRPRRVERAEVRCTSWIGVTS
jgi:hypothetical protein